MSSPANTIRILFSDIDGTCVHYPNATLIETSVLDDNGILHFHQHSEGPTAPCLKLPPSTSGAVGIISVQTLQLYAAIRSLGVKVVLISGARFNTMIQRLPYLPAADAYVCESGGRIFYPSDELPTAAAIREDHAWRRQHESAAGSVLEESKPPSERNGDLWDIFRKLQSEGAMLDANSYTTAFRMKKLPSGMNSKWLESLLPPTLSSAVNLGAADVYPATSGKLKAARYLMVRFGGATDGADSVFMCDDDNDLELAHAVQKAYLPSITAVTLARAVKASPSRFHISDKHEVWATEDILQHLVQKCTAQQ